MPAVQVPTVAGQPPRPDSGAGGRRRVLTGRVAVTGALLAAAWLLPLATHAAGVDILLVPVLVISAASLLRGGRTATDQLLLATVLLFGAFCVVSLATSALGTSAHPVVVTGTTLTALVLLGAAAGRRPRLALRHRRPDLVLLAAGLLVAALTLRQFVQRDRVGRLALLAPGEDLARHFGLVDAVGTLDGYAFFHPQAAAQITVLTNYPQGWHLLVAVLDRYWRSAGGWVGGVDAMDFMIWCHVLTFVWFAAAVLWALRRLAGPGPGWQRATLALGTGVGYLFLGDPVTVLLRGFPNELAGLGLTAVLVAVLARPLHHPVEQIATVALLLVGISFTYYLFLPVAGLLAAGWAVTARAVLLRHRAVTLAAVAVAATTLVPVLLNPEANSGTQLLLPGTAIPVDGTMLLVMLLLAATALAAWRGLRSRAWRVWAAATAGALAMAVAIEAFQHLQTGGGSSYYGVKAYHLVVVLAVLGLGAAARLAPVPGIGRPPAGGEQAGGEPRTGGRRAALALLWRGRVLPLVPVACLLVAALVALGVTGPPSSSEGGSFGMGLLRGREGVRPDGPATAYRASRTWPDGDGRITVDLSHGGWANFYGTLYGVAMQRTYMVGAGWCAFLNPAGAPKTMADLEQEVLASGRPVRFVVGDPQVRFLVLDPGAPRRPAAGAGRDDTGDEGAPTNVEAARYLAGKYPDRVQVVTLGG